MKINRILTNNALIVLDDDGNEKIICGRGIGYKKQRGDIVDASNVNKTFVLERSESIRKLEGILCDIPIECVEVSKEIVDYAGQKLSIDLRDSLIISLSDHISAVIGRVKDGLDITNGLYWEVKRFYENEYEIGQYAVQKIKEKLGFELPDVEAASIALHFVNAQIDGEAENQAYKITQLMQEILSIIRFFLSKPIDEESPYYYRFMTHLKFFAKRVFEQNYTSYGTENEFIDIVREKYKNAFACSERIGAFLKEKYDYHLSNEEKMYLTIHIQRVIHKDKTEELEL